MRGLAESGVTKKDSRCAEKIKKKNIYILCERETEWERDLIENEKKEHVNVSYYQQSLIYSI